MTAQHRAAPTRAAPGADPTARERVDLFVGGRGTVAIAVACSSFPDPSATAVTNSWPTRRSQRGRDDAITLWENVLVTP